jgi:hypothetical protein
MFTENAQAQTLAVKFQRAGEMGENDFKPFA